MRNAKQKVLVTGANGFLGREVVGELLKTDDYEVCGLTGKSSKTNSPGDIPAINLLSVDISDYETLLPAKKHFGEIETVIHTAGLAHQFGRTARDDFWKINVAGTENICRLALELGAKNFVLISSVAIYGDYGSAEIDESFDCRPEGFYAESKFESERRAFEILKKQDISLTILRPATIVGEGDRGNTARLIKLIDKKRFVWVGNGENKKSLIYKNDAARGILKVIENRQAVDVEIYNLTAPALSMKEIVRTIAESLQTKTPRLKVPENLLRTFFKLNRTPLSNEYLRKFEKTFEKWLSDDIFSGRKFNERFEFKPATTISEALARQVDYYLRRKKEKN